MYTNNHNHSEIRTDEHSIYTACGGLLWYIPIKTYFLWYIPIKTDLLTVNFTNPIAHVLPIWINDLETHFCNRHNALPVALRPFTNSSWVSSHCGCCQNVEINPSLEASVGLPMQPTKRFLQASKLNDLHCKGTTNTNTSFLVKKNVT